MDTRPPAEIDRATPPDVDPATTFTSRLGALEAALSACEDARSDLRGGVRQCGIAVARLRRTRDSAASSDGAKDAANPAPPAERTWEDTLIQEHIGLARHLAARYNRRGESAEDLEQVALLALVRAARRWDPARGIPFSGYASPSILGEIKRYFRDRSWAMRVPRPLKELYLQAKAARDEMVNESGRVPTVAELAERLDCTHEQLLEAMEAGHNFRPASIDGLDEVRARQLPSADGGFDRVIDRARLAQLLPALNDEEQRIVHLRFVEEQTQSSIAAEFGVSQMHISRTLERILTKLRVGMRSD